MANISFSATYTPEPVPQGTGILVVDSDEVIRELISSNLCAEFDVTVAATAAEALGLDIVSFSLVIIDTVLQGGMSGLEFMTRVKQDPAMAELPFIICSARDSEDDILGGFDAGADDYVVKPFSLRELVARVKSVLRRHRMTAVRAAAAPAPAETAAPPQNSIAAGNMRLMTDTRRLQVGRRLTSLSPTEFKLMKLFMENAGRLVSRDEIQASVWPDAESVGSRTIDVNISRIRKKLGEAGELLVSRPGAGYGFETL